MRFVPDTTDVPRDLLNEDVTPALIQREMGLDAWNDAVRIIVDGEDHGDDASVVAVRLWRLYQRHSGHQMAVA